MGTAGQSAGIFRCFFFQAAAVVAYCGTGDCCGGHTVPDWVGGKPCQRHPAESKFFFFPVTCLVWKCILGGTGLAWFYGDQCVAAAARQCFLFNCNLDCAAACCGRSTGQRHGKRAVAGKGICQPRRQLYSSHHPAPANCVACNGFHPCHWAAAGLGGLLAPTFGPGGICCSQHRSNHSVDCTFRYVDAASCVAGS